MQQNLKSDRQVKGFATDCQNRQTPNGVRTIGKPDFQEEENMQSTGEETDKRVSRYIRITDDLKWEYIDRIMQRGEYRHSFNKVINDALDYGLPQLLKVAYGETEEDGLPSTEPQVVTHEIKFIDEELAAEIVDLLEEVLLNALLTKSIVASLFNERVKQLGGCSVKPQVFERGDFRDTPSYLAEHEKMIMDRINKSRRERQNGQSNGEGGEQ